MPGGHERRDHYAVLGVPSSASDRQITTAYRRLVRSLHPDTRPADPAAADALSDVLAAYDTLHDAGRRAAYDAARDRPAGGAAPGRPVPVRVTRRTAPSSPWPAGPKLFDQRFEHAFDQASWRIGPGFVGLSFGPNDSGLVTRILRQWLRGTDSWF
jgi:curved DNA-binding protein CbpA